MADREHAPQEQTTARGRRVLLLVLSLLFMLPWPLAGIAVVHTHFDNGNESLLMFGGLVAIPAALLSLLGAPEWVFLGVVLLVWIGVWVFPTLFLRKRLSSRGGALMVLAIQAAFSLSQALVGMLMIWGKAV
jgi:hypothetical protein